MAVLKKHHRAAHYGHYYECMVKFKGVAYNKVCDKTPRPCMIRISYDMYVYENIKNFNTMTQRVEYPSHNI